MPIYNNNFFENNSFNYEQYPYQIYLTGFPSFPGFPWGNSGRNFWEWLYHIKLYLWVKADSALYRLYLFFKNNIL